MIYDEVDEGRLIESCKPKVEKHSIFINLKANSKISCIFQR